MMRNNIGCKPIMSTVYSMEIVIYFGTPSISVVNIINLNFAHSRRGKF